MMLSFWYAKSKVSLYHLGTEALLFSTEGLALEKETEGLA